MGSCCSKRGADSERTPIVQPSVEEASGRLEKQKKTLEEDIEKLRQDLEETRWPLAAWKGRGSYECALHNEWPVYGWINCNISYNI